MQRDTRSQRSAGESPVGPGPEWSVEREDEIGGAIRFGEPQLVGSFRYYLADRRWEWSDEVAVMHGYEPGTVVPTTELLLAHKHPDDRARVATTLTGTVQHGEPFCSRHRIIDTRGETHRVIVVGDRLIGESGDLLGTAGFYIDVTETDAGDRPETRDGGLADLHESRAAIEQAKGALMLVYGISAEKAFDVLVWRSQETNTKLRRLAQRLVAELSEAANAPTGLRTVFDHLLLTVHERVEDDQASEGQAQ